MAAQQPVAAGVLPGADKPYERTMFSYDPIDEFTATIADWIYFHSQNLANVEIEAKIGTLVDKSTEMRLFMPVMTETVLMENTEGIRFVSQLMVNHHSAMNKLMNQLVTYTNVKGYPGSKIVYKRQEEIDHFHKLEPGSLPPAVLESLAGGEGQKEDKIRVTRDKHGKAKSDHAMVKRRIASLEIYCPKRAYDYRISINTETPVPLPKEDSISLFWRDKNRVTYQHELIQVDLTLVQSTFPLTGTQITHELEVEFQDASKLIAAGHEARSGGVSQDWTPFDDMCHIFLNNVRMLIRNMPELQS
ncbi:unnamed protein product [Tilletia controversa]|uniref:mRNA-capping enzyme subunit beta n=3 Tax=Tilletia TaxID=13289 RepID=A0A8X7MXM1_9BASI|nr:hypothetical protein CF336_g2063 [Tilletia laevis]KAE8202889.1 hypothetical protein CF328_g1958 [Tilletia controversa]KAE8263536.1 hypothetical protein A4X03_0g1608 [Tilletia caries]KAE8207098.1 hypothetical protein CF335_g1393 [Tilletia laevis]KAE8251907.1 hypothetical protein A4X06_0g2489 [Tilletia controversa]